MYKSYGYRLPEDFLIGTASSAFQIEGAWDRDGKSPSMMDHYARLYAGKPAPHGGAQQEEGTTRRAVQPPMTEDLPDNGTFFYDYYEEYIEDMAKTGQNVFRFSLAWPRIIPNGVGEVNPKGIEFYNKVINKLLEKGITPFVDLYHWDLPQCLEDIGGFLNPNFPDWFEAYAKVCFEAFGDRVKMWSTFNELSIIVTGGYANGRFPPYHHEIKEGLLAGHLSMIAHFRVVRLYKSMNLGGKIGMVNCISNTTPARMVEEDTGAVARQIERDFFWWTQTAMEGTYPQRLIRECAFIRDNMPENYQADLDKYFIPMDFVGVNYYISNRTSYNPEKPLLSDRVTSFYAAPGQSFAPYPAGMLDVVLWIAERYPHLDIYITENGCAIPNRHDPEVECEDPERITYLREHLRMCARIVRMGYRLKGYMYWNDSDCYETGSGYDLRFGLTWVNHETGERRWKQSRYYFSEICKSHLVN